MLYCYCRHRIPVDNWWLKLRPLLRILAKHESVYEVESIAVVAEDVDVGVNLAAWMIPSLCRLLLLSVLQQTSCGFSHVTSLAVFILPCSIVSLGTPTSRPAPCWSQCCQRHTNVSLHFVFCRSWWEVDAPPSFCTHTSVLWMLWKKRTFSMHLRRKSSFM